MSLFTPGNQLFNKTPADQIVGYDHSLWSQETGKLWGARVLIDPLLSMDELEETQKNAQKIFDMVMQNKHPKGAKGVVVPDHQLYDNLHSLSCSLETIGGRVEERARNIEQAVETFKSSSKKYEKNIEYLKAASKRILDQADQMELISEMVKTRSQYGDTTIQDDSIRLVQLDRLLPKVEESKSLLNKIAQ